MTFVLDTDSIHPLKAILAQIAPGAAPSATMVAELESLVREFLQAGRSPEELPLDPTWVPRPSNSYVRSIIPLARTHKRKNGDKLYDCPFCHHADKFYEGWVILCDDGKLRLIGEDCKTHHLDAHVITTGFEQYSNRIWDDFYRRVAPAAIVAAQALSEAVDRIVMADWQTLDICRQLRIEMSAKFHLVLRELYRSIRLGESRLNVERLVEDWARFNRSVDRADQNIPMQHVTMTVGVLSGTQWLLPENAEPLERVRSAQRKLREISSSLKGYGRAPRGDATLVRNIRKFVREGRIALRELEEAQKTIRSMIVFFSESNLKHMGRWLADRDNPLSSELEFSPVSSGFEWIDKNLEENRIVLPAAVTDLHIRGMRELDQAIKQCMRGVLNRRE